VAISAEPCANIFRAAPFPRYQFIYSFLHINQGKNAQKVKYFWEYCGNYADNLTKQKIVWYNNRMDKQYLIGRCQYNRENRSAEQINREGGEAIVPRVKVRVLRRGKIIETQRPLISEYLFIKNKPKETPREKYWRYLVIGGEIAKTSYDEIEHVVSICAEFDNVKNEDNKMLVFKRGQQVRVVAGLLINQIAKFACYIRNGKRARIVFERKLITVKSEQLEEVS
jgi:transcription antitermination factor NusG